MDVTVRRSHIEPLGSGLRRSYQAVPAGGRREEGAGSCMQQWKK